MKLLTGEDTTALRTNGKYSKFQNAVLVSRVSIVASTHGNRDLKNSPTDPYSDVSDDEEDPNDAFSRTKGTTKSLCVTSVRKTKSHCWGISKAVIQPIAVEFAPLYNSYIIQMHLQASG